jgi:DNA repair protein RecO (recombination protein O)
MIEKTEGIVLRSRPFSRTSRMVTWLTPDFGRVTTVIKGACRPKSFFLGQTDLGYRCELLFYRREHAGAHIAREVFPLDCREALRGNWRASVAASYVCWLLSQVTEPMLASAELYGLLDGVLKTISDAPREARLENILVDFEFLLLDLLGVSPNFSYCQDCTFGPDKRKSCRFLLSDGRLGCIHALSIHHESADSVALTTSLVYALAKAQAAARLGSDAVGEAAGSAAQPPNPRLAIGIRRFLGLFISHHLDVPMHPRATAYAWLDWDRYDKELVSSLSVPGS